MGKYPVSFGIRTSAEPASSNQPAVLLPPPPPLHPRPEFLQPVAVPVRLGLLGHSEAKKEEDEQSNEPLDYSMKSLGQPLPSPSPPPSSMSDSPMSLVGSTLEECQRCIYDSDQLMHKLRHTVLQRGHYRVPMTVGSLASLSTSQARTVLKDAAAATAVAIPSAKFSPGKLRPQAAADSPESEAESNAAYAAECIKSRLDGCGKRVHLFLGILLHFGMPPGPNGEQMFNRVISFSDEHKNLSDKPTAYFMVLDSKLLALVWSKFKGNSSNEYSTLTRAIRSTRQKYKGIFESVKNPGKKLYKFGPVAVEQFRNLFPLSYAN